MRTEEIIEQLQEIRKEITRVNQAAGETIFNPCATSALEGISNFFLEVVDKGNNYEDTLPEDVELEER